MDHDSETHAARPQGFMERHHFLLRRLHSLTGIVPIGLFLIPHLTTNSSIVWGRFNKRGGEGLQFTPDETGAAQAVGTFQHEVSFINDIPFLLLIEITLWLSIAFHSILGVYYARTGKGNAQRYAYQDNWRYTMQRWTGYFGIFFIVYHIATLRWGWSFLVPGGTEWSHHYAASTTAAALQGASWDDPSGPTVWGILISLFYMAGVTALVFHFANGLWTAAITWGLTVTEKAQKQWGYVCAALGSGLMLMGWASVIGFLITDVDYAKTWEEQLHKDSAAQVETARDERAGNESAEGSD